MYSSNNFSKITKKISQDIQDHLLRQSKNKTHNFYDKLDIAIELWCFYLMKDSRLGFTQEIKNSIIPTYKKKEVQNLCEDAYNERNLILKKRTKTGFWEKSEDINTGFHNIIKKCLNILNMENKEMNFVIIFAFIIVIVLFTIYLINQPKQTAEEKKDTQNFYTKKNQDDSINNLKSPRITSVVTTYQKCLILIIPNLKSNLIEFLITKNKLIINEENCMNLYDSTRFLSLENTENLDIKLLEIRNNYLCQNLESDVYIVKINLKQSDDALEPNVNQNKRLNGFKRLINLEAELLGRFPIEAYKTFNVYPISN